MDHVADVMQQRGQHGGRRGTVGLGQRRRLQRVLELVAFAEALAARGAADEDAEEFLTEGVADGRIVDGGIVHARFLS
jgi:hypothetical protein